VVVGVFVAIVVVVTVTGVVAVDVYVDDLLLS